MTDEPEAHAGELVLSFADAGALEVWLAAQTRDAPRIWLKLAKKNAGLSGLTSEEAIDAALCHGWIDGQQQPCDSAFWLTRFTRRRPASRWSQVNRTRAPELLQEGWMRPIGLVAIDAARADGRWDAAYAPSRTAMPCPELQAALDVSPAATAVFATLPGADRYAVLYRLVNLKTSVARTRRIATYVAMLERGEAIHVQPQAKTSRLAIPLRPKSIPAHPSSRAAAC